jgi:penicillin-binding protein 1C
MSVSGKRARCPARWWWVRSKLWRACLVAGFALTAALLVLRFLPHAPLKERAVYSRAFFSSDAALLRLTLAPDEQYRLWTPLQQISPALQKAVLLYEDRWFYAHPGFNPVSLVASAHSTWQGTQRRGGSTISMQLARRLWRIDSRSPVGKLKQVAAAVWLEARYSKGEILEAYLNFAPYGGNVEGVGAASWTYFNKAADKLLMPEALALAVIPQNPNRRGAATAHADAWPMVLEAARQRLWNKWQLHQGTSRASDATVMNLPLRLRSTRQLPFAAPHAVQAALQTPGATATTPLSLHAPTQTTLERAVTQFVHSRGGAGIHNAAALLVDTRNMHITGWVGSADYGNEAIDGQVNATRAKRSPGSTLKPFIYALALDQGLLHPRSILKDAPTAFGTYSPENFDGRFEGPVTAQDALVRSRNVPAVSVATRLRNPSLFDMLKRAQVGHLASEQHYGLALPLGGAELSMEELATLYAALANGGRWQGLRLLPNPGVDEAGVDEAVFDKASAPSLFSPEAAFITLDMLQHNPRPDTGQPAFPPVAWKTGTSWGFRDAWTAGVFGHHVLVVWVGNFDGSSNPAFVGVQAAAPLFFSIVDSLRSQGLAGLNTAVSASVATNKVRRVDVCAASGDLPNDECKTLASTWFIPGVSPIKVSTLHRAVWVDRASGRALCGPAPGATQEVFEHWGSDMLQVFAQAGMPRRLPPAPPRCGSSNSAATAVSTSAPRIVSPLRGASYVLRQGKTQTLGLRAESLGAGAVHWFADAAYLGTSAAGKDLVWAPPAAGRYSISAVDEAGNADARDVVVEFAP